MFGFSRLSLLWKTLLSTSIAITLLFAVTVWIVQHHVVQTTSESLEDEVRASFRAYESLWRAHADKLASISLILSTMSDVRAAFTTGDEATIRDTAAELWNRVSEDNALFLVTDPNGAVITSLGGNPRIPMPRTMPLVGEAAASFPKQSQGFLRLEGRLYQVIVTPVYVQSNGGPGLIDVLVAGYEVNNQTAAQLKEATGGSDFAFVAGADVVASSLAGGVSSAILTAANRYSDRPGRITDGQTEYMAFSTPLVDVRGHPVGRLSIFRSFATADQRLESLRWNILLTWIAAVLAGLAVTYVLARRILSPVKRLDRAAEAIARGNYDIQLPVESRDELGRLTETFNNMCSSIRSARRELIHKEQIATIGRLSTSLVHDLRNPLAAIYGGAEMMVDSDLPPSQMKRLAQNIYRSSRRIQELLQDLVNVSRGKENAVEVCRLRDVIIAAWDVLARVAETQAVTLSVNVPEDIELPLERSRMERVFVNLFSNSLDAMPDGGRIEIVAHRDEAVVLVEVGDTGPGISNEVRASLFQPFHSRKRNGLGLGLALSRQTVIDQGGDMWADSEEAGGARFCIRL
ncbi:MAG: ATP-binding protein [Bryobacteraceae bacterium]|jgi:signal transduction histidine kinase